MYRPLSNVVGAFRLKQMLMFDFMSEEAARGRSLGTQQVTQNLVQDFCNRSIRRYLRLRKRIAMSVAVERAISRRVRRQDEEGYMPYYAFLDGWLTGGRDHFDEFDEYHVHNDVLNLYKTTTQPACAHTTLIGPHLLYLLRRGKYWSDELVNTLTQIGYVRAEVEDCLNAMHRIELFKYGRLGSSGNRAIEVEDSVIEAHRVLLESPAYADNMAIVTPVEERHLEHMQHTVSYETEEFVARVKTTCCFLQQLRDDEVTVNTWKEGSPRHTMDPQEFKRAFNAFSPPSIYRKAAVKYYARLVAVRRHPGRLREVMTDDAWDELMENEVLLVDAREAHKPLRAHIEKPAPDSKPSARSRRSAR